jgi:hypothetical protein
VGVAGGTDLIAQRGSRGHGGLWRPTPAPASLHGRAGLWAGRQADELGEKRQREDRGTAAHRRQCPRLQGCAATQIYGDKRIGVGGRGSRGAGVGGRWAASWAFDGGPWCRRVGTWCPSGLAASRARVSLRAGSSEGTGQDRWEWEEGSWRGATSGKAAGLAGGKPGSRRPSLAVRLKGELE